MNRERNVVPSKYGARRRVLQRFSKLHLQRTLKLNKIGTEEQGFAIDKWAAGWRKYSSMRQRKKKRDVERKCACA